MSSLEKILPDLEKRAKEFDIYESEMMTQGMRALFAKHVKNGMTTLRQAQIDEDRDQVHWVAHSLKGIGGTCGYPEISVFGEDFSTLINTGGDWNQIAIFVDALNAWIIEHQAELDAASE